MKKLWDTVDRWGPGAIAILTLAAMIALSWIYSSRLSYQQGQIDALENERTKNWQMIETYRLEVQALRVEMARAGGKTNEKED